MTDVRNTQIAAEHWLTASPSGQLTQIALEQWSQVTSAGIQAITTQMALEHWASVVVVSASINGPIITMIS